jgi:dihydrofolate synthase/folylpolyglutamate synthase
MEVLSTWPLLLADGAHNPYSMAVLLRSLPEYLSYRRIVLIVGFSRDKQISEMVNLLAQQAATVYATRSRHPRSVPPNQLGEMFRNRGVASVAEIDTVDEALGLARQAAGPEDLILGTGSLFVAAELREAVLGIEPELYPDLLPAVKPPAR